LTYNVLSEVKRMVGVEELGAFTQIGAFWVNRRSYCHVNMGQFVEKVSRVWSGAAQPSPPCTASFLLRVLKLG
jgi:hypothetical protein